MTDITTYPMIDDFDTTLAQAWDGAVGTVYLNDAVGITLPASTTTYIVVNPGKSTMQVAKINAVNNTLKTATVSSTTVDKGAGVAYTQQSHPVGSVVRISTNYAFWKDIVDSLNTKVNTNDDDIAQGKFADATARDAYFTSPVNGNSAYLTAEGKRTDYVAGSWADRDVGTVTANASTTVAGKVEIATTAQITAGTATGETGASLVATPAGISAQVQNGSYLYAEDAGANDTYVITLVPAITAYTTGMRILFKANTSNTGACTLNVNGLGAKNIITKDANNPQNGVIRGGGKFMVTYDGASFVLDTEDFATATVKGTVEMATDAEANTGTDETRYVNSKQAKQNTYAGVLDHDTSNASGTVVVAHGLGKTPVSMSFTTYGLEGGNHTSFAGQNQNVGREVVYNSGSDVVTNATGYLIKYQDAGGDTYTLSVAFDSTNITFTKTAVGTVSASTLQSTYIVSA